MKDLRKQAIVLIYPDGEVEKIPVRAGVTEHLDYFHEWFKVSKKFAKVIYKTPYKIDFKDWVVLDRTLAEAGLVVIRNCAICDLSYDISLVDLEEAFVYLINLPSDIIENKAYLPMKEILRKNQNEKYTFGIYSLDTRYFLEMEYNFLEEELEDKESEIRL